jgi:hypothetical protein
MSYPPAAADPDLHGLFSLFPPAEYMARSDLVSPEELPPPFDRLLFHEHHMTVTVEAYHGEPVDVEVLREYRGRQTYTRNSLLRLRQSRLVVQYNLMRVHFRYCSEAVRREILSGGTPLGRVLINHNVLRRVMPTAFLRIAPGPALARWFGPQAPRETYGRLALIVCDERPAVEVVEIVVPE